MASDYVSESRVAAFRECLLNTCVRAARPHFTEGLSLSNCLESEDFRELTRHCLRMPLFSKPVEPAMEVARQSLLTELQEGGGS